MWSGVGPPSFGSEVLVMSTWLLNVTAGLYLSLLFLVHRNRLHLSLWVLGFCLLTYLFTHSA